VFSINRQEFSSFCTKSGQLLEIFFKTRLAQAQKYASYQKGLDPSRDTVILNPRLREDKMAACLGIDVLVVPGEALAPQLLT